MALQSQEIAALVETVRRGSSASAVLPLLQELAQAKRIHDLPPAIVVATEAMEINRTLAAQFLAQRVPALIVNRYWPQALDSEKLEKLFSYTLEHREWSAAIVDAALSGDGAQLVAAIEQVESDADLHALIERPAQQKLDQE